MLLIAIRYNSTRGWIDIAKAGLNRLGATSRSLLIALTGLFRSSRKTPIAVSGFCVKAKLDVKIEISSIKNDLTCPVNINRVAFTLKKIAHQLTHSL
jgi:hypothetical protein